MPDPKEPEISWSMLDAGLGAYIEYDAALYGTDEMLKAVFRAMFAEYEKESTHAPSPF